MVALDQLVFNRMLPPYSELEHKLRPPSLFGQISEVALVVTHKWVINRFYYFFGEICRAHARSFLKVRSVN